MLFDLGKLISKVKAQKSSISKMLESQLKIFKETDVSCLLRLGLLPLINRASKIFLLSLLCLYPKLRIEKSSGVTRAWFEFIKCWYT